MIINASSYGSGSCKKAVLYLLQKKDSKGQVREHVQVLHGYPEMVAMMADSLSFKNRYSSLVLAWSPKDDPSHAEMKETLQSFADLAFPGMQDRAAWTAVLHKGGEQEGKHIHIIVAKADLETGRSWNPFPPGWDQQFRCWRQLQDLGKRWTSPDELQLDYLERVEDASGEKELRHEARLYINRWLQGRPDIRCRDDLVAALKEGGREFEATKSAISLIVRAVDGKAVRPTRVRLTGPVFEAGWKRDETEISRMAEEARLERLEVLQVAVEKARAARLAVNTERILKLGERHGEAVVRASEAVSAAIAKGVTGHDLVELWSKAERSRSQSPEEEIDDPAMALDELAQSVPERREEHSSAKDYGEDEQRRLSVLAREVWQARMERERHEREELERWRQANEKRREQRLHDDARREARLRQLAEQSQQQMRLELSFEQEMRRSQQQAAQQLEQLRQNLNNQEKVHEQQQLIPHAPSLPNLDHLLKLQQQYSELVQALTVPQCTLTHTRESRLRSLALVLVSMGLAPEMPAPEFSQTTQEWVKRLLSRVKPPEEPEEPILPNERAHSFVVLLTRAQAKVEEHDDLLRREVRQDSKQIEPLKIMNAELHQKVQEMEKAKGDREKEISLERASFQMALAAYESASAVRLAWKEKMAKVDDRIWTSLRSRDFLWEAAFPEPLPLCLNQVQAEQLSETVKRLAAMAESRDPNFLERIKTQQQGRYAEQLEMQMDQLISRVREDFRMCATCSKFSCSSRIGVALIGSCQARLLPEPPWQEIIDQGRKTSYGGQRMETRLWDNRLACRDHCDFYESLPTALPQ